MFASLSAEAIKMRRLWLPAIAIASGMILSGLVWLSTSDAGARLATEERMEVPWQDGLIGDVTVTMTLVLPVLVTLVTALCFLVEHRGDMWKQLRATPQPLHEIYLAKFLVIQVLICLSFFTAVFATFVGWWMLPEPLHTELARSGVGAFRSIVGLAGMLYLATLPIALIQFVLSARMSNILHPVGIGFLATIGCLMAMGPGTGPWLPYAYPGVVIMDRFAVDRGERSPEQKQQETDTEYRAPRDALAGVRKGGTILVDHAHSNRHGLGTTAEPGTLHWIVGPANAAGLQLRSSGTEVAPDTLRDARLLIVAGASRAFSAHESETVVAWVDRGGSLLLLTDHEPFASPTVELGGRLGTRFSIASVSGTENDGSGRVRFRREDGSIAPHPLTAGVRTALTYGGQGLWRPNPGTVRLLRLRDTAGVKEASQLIAFSLGRGRVIISGETGLFTAQRHGAGSKIGVADPDVDNERLVLNTLRWLLRAKLG